MLVFWILSVLTLTSNAVSIQLPRLTGQYAVGMTEMEVIDYSRLDLSAPGRQHRKLMVSVFYPTHPGQTGRYKRAPYFSSAKTAAAFGTSYLGNSTRLMDIQLQSYQDAPPIASGDFGVLIFSHGLGSARVMHSAQLENLASNGWIIVAPDHPYDALATEFPNGEFVTMPESVLDNFPSKMPSLIQIRVADVMFLANLIKNATIFSKIPSRQAWSTDAINTRQLGIFGHSLGGASAAQTVANFSSTFKCGANYDGGIFGPVASTGLSSPFLEVEAFNHNQTTDSTFANFWPQLHGFRRKFGVKDTVHISFMDIPLLKDLMGKDFPAEIRNQSGSIRGTELLAIETSLVDNFFGFCLKGEIVSRLDSVSFPDVYIPQ